MGGIMISDCKYVLEVIVCFLAAVIFFIVTYKLSFSNSKFMYLTGILGCLALVEMIVSIIQPFI